MLTAGVNDAMRHICDEGDELNELNAASSHVYRYNNPEIMFLTLNVPYAESNQSLHVPPQHSVNERLTLE